MTQELNDRVFQAYEDVQLLGRTETIVSKQRIDDLADNWKDDEVPALQKKVVDIQLDNLQKGFVDPVFSSLMTALQAVELSSFTLLDAACATGYYLEVIRGLDKRQIEYNGCDYSEAMIKVARMNYPEIKFEVQDLTQLSYPNQSFDVVLVSGVLEHIPDYQIAIAEVCRVAKHYLIIHRCPLITRYDHVYTIGTQYNIYTPRIYFSESKLEQELHAQNFSLIKRVKITYYHQVTWLHKIKSFVKKVIFLDKILGRQNMAVKTQTLVFKKYDQ